MDICVRDSVWTCLLFLGMYLGVKLLGLKVTYLCLTFRRSSRLFSKVAAPQRGLRFQVLCPLATGSRLCCSGHPSGYFALALPHFSKADCAEHLFTCLLVNRMSLEKHLFMAFAYPKAECFYILNCKSSLYSRCNSLIRICFINIFLICALAFRVLFSYL